MSYSSGEFTILRETEIECNYCDFKGLVQASVEAGVEHYECPKCSVPGWVEDE